VTLKKKKGTPYHLLGMDCYEIKDGETPARRVHTTPDQPLFKNTNHPSKQSDHIPKATNSLGKSRKRSCRTQRGRVLRALPNEKCSAFRQAQRSLAEFVGREEMGKAMQEALVGETASPDDRVQTKGRAMTNPQDKDNRECTTSRAHFVAG